MLLGRNGSAHAIRRVLIPATIALTLGAVGCGDQPPAPVAELAPAAPVASNVAATQRAAQVESARAQLAGLGLAEIPFAAIDAAPVADGVDPSLGPAPSPIAESSLRIERDTPRALLDGALSALASEDVAALARLSRGRGHALNQDDAGDARRRFLAPAGRVYWERIAQALSQGAFDVSEDGQAAVVRLDVGGAAGSYQVRMRKESDGWYLDG